MVCDHCKEEIKAGEEVPCICIWEEDECKMKWYYCKRCNDNVFIGDMANEIDCTTSFDSKSPNLSETFLR